MDYYEELRLKNLELRRLVFEAIKFVREDMDALKDGISISGVLCPGPEDSGLVEEIRAKEVWMARARIELGVTE